MARGATASSLVIILLPTGGWDSERESLGNVLKLNYHISRQCNLDFSTDYSVYISASNNFGFSPKMQYNFTTEQLSLVNLPWSGANRY